MKYFKNIKICRYFIKKKYLMRDDVILEKISKGLKNVSFKSRGISSPIYPTSSTGYKIVFLKLIYIKFYLNN